MSGPLADGREPADPYSMAALGRREALAEQIARLLPGAETETLSRPPGTTITLPYNGGSVMIRSTTAATEDVSFRLSAWPAGAALAISGVLASFTEARLAYLAQVAQVAQVAQNAREGR